LPASPRDPGGVIFTDGVIGLPVTGDVRPLVAVLP